MKDFPYWSSEIYQAKTIQALKGIGEEIARFQNQTDFLGGHIKLNDYQLKELRNMFGEKMKKLENEMLTVKPPEKPEFNK